MSKENYKMYSRRGAPGAGICTQRDKVFKEKSDPKWNSENDDFKARPHPA